MDFLDAMRLPPAAPVPMPAMDPGPDAGTAWHDALAGRGPELTFGNTREAARQWLSQPFGRAVDMDPKITTGKA